MSDPYIRGINDSNLTNKFSELTDTQREKLFAQYGSKKDAKAAYKDARTRFAGDEVADNPAAVKLIDDSAAAIDASATFPDGAPRMDPEEDNIYKYDTRAYGAGSQKGDDGKAQLSSKDLSNLSNKKVTTMGLKNKSAGFYKNVDNLPPNYLDIVDNVLLLKKNEHI